MSSALEAVVNDRAADMAERDGERRFALPEHGGTVKLTRTRVRISKAGAAAAIRLYVSSGSLAKLRHALLRRRRLYASVQVEATDPVTGIEYILARRIALTR